MTTHILSMTYQPKIEGVRNGTIRQTIRLYNEKRPFKVGDKLLIHGWAGKPYRSKWSWRMEATVNFCPEINMIADKDVVRVPVWSHAIRDFAWVPVFWDQDYANELARLDGISPPCGPELKRVLETYHGKFTDEPVQMQVIRW